MKKIRRKPNHEMDDNCVARVIRRATSGWVTVKGSEMTSPSRAMVNTASGSSRPEEERPVNPWGRISIQKSDCVSIAVFESERLAMATDINKWEGVETGGLLYGAYTNPLAVVVMLATTSGPLTVRQPARLVMDLQYAELTDGIIVARTGLTCVGRWHNHLTSGMCQLSYTDDTSRASLRGRNDRDVFLDFVLGRDPFRATGVRLYPYAQVQHGDECRQASVRILDGYSPIRKLLIGASALPLDDLFREWRSDVHVTIEPLIEDRAERDIIGMIETQIQDLPTGVVQNLSVLVDDAGIAVRLSVRGQDILVGYTRSVPPRPVSIAALSPSGAIDDGVLTGRDITACTLLDLVHMLGAEHGRTSNIAPRQDPESAVVIGGVPSEPRDTATADIPQNEDAHAPDDEPSSVDMRGYGDAITPTASEQEVI